VSWYRPVKGGFDLLVWPIPLTGLDKHEHESVLGSPFPGVGHPVSTWEMEIGKRSPLHCYRPARLQFGEQLIQ
jgi:hypothetical protein